MTEVSAHSRAARGPLHWSGVALVALVGAVALLLMHPGTAHAAPLATNATVESADPSAITFKVRITSDADLASATLNYKVLNPDNNVGGTLRAEVSGRTADASASLQVISNERYIPVGNEITYSWTITDKNGASTTTPEQKMTFLDGRYQWSSKEQGRVKVFWYGPNEPNADAALKATVESIATNEALLKVSLGYPIRVVLWRNSADAKAAQRPRAATFDQQVTTGGSRVAADVLHIYDPLGNFVDVARHEAAHIVTKVAGDGGVSQIPSWLDEGTAVFAQNSPGDYEVAVKQAIATDQVIRLRSMSAPTNNPNLVNVFYGQSWAVVKFMVDRYGKDKFAAVFKSVKDDGAPIDEALQKHLGVDQDGLMNAWRQSVGLKTIDYPPVPKGTSLGGQQATQVPLGIPKSVTSAASTDGGGSGAAETGGVGGVSTTTAGIVGGIALALAAALGFGALQLSRKR